MEINIHIISSSNITKIFLNTEQNIFLVNNNKSNIDISTFVSKLLSIVSNWEENLINYSLIDSEYYEISIKENDIQKKYVGNSLMAKNYHVFKNLISEVENAQSNN